VEAAAEGDLFVGLDERWAEGPQNGRDVGWAGLLDERDEDEVAAAEFGFVVLEGGKLLTVAMIERGGSEDEQDAVAVDEVGEGLLGAGDWDEEREDQQGFDHLAAFFEGGFFLLVCAFFWTRSL